MGTHPAVDDIPGAGVLAGASGPHPRLEGDVLSKVVEDPDLRDAERELGGPLNADELGPPPSTVADELLIGRGRREGTHAHEGSEKKARAHL